MMIDSKKGGKTKEETPSLTLRNLEMRQGSSFVPQLTRERVDFLLTKFPNREEFKKLHPIKLASHPEGCNRERHCVHQTNLINEIIDELTYQKGKIDWFVGRELLYCEFTKDLIEKKKRNNDKNLFYDLRDKWELVGLNLSIDGLFSLVCRLVVSRGD